MRMKDLSLDLYHHDTTGISDSEIRNYFSLNDNWLSDHGKRFQINNMQKHKKESDGNNANSDIVNNNSNSDNIVPERLRSFKWNDEIGDREEIVLNEDNNNNIIHLLDEVISDVDKTTISNITAQGKYWWGGYDNDGRHELIHPYTSIKDNNASKLMLQLQNVGIPSKYQFKSLVNSILYDIPFDMLLQSKLNFHDDSTSSLQIANDIHLPSLLVQHGLLTLESRAAVVREFHSEVFIRLCFPNEFCQDEVVTMTLGTWMGFTLEKIELVKSTLQSIHMELMSLSLENESKLLDHFESLRKIILEESYLNDLASSTVTGNSFSDDFSSSSMLITDEQVRSYLFLFLLSCIPNIQVSRTDPIYLEGGASDTFVHEETVGNVDSNHGNTISIEKNLLENSLVFSLSSDDESSKTSCVRIKSINGDVIDLERAFSTGQLSVQQVSNEAETRQSNVGGLGDLTGQMRFKEIVSIILNKNKKMNNNDNDNNNNNNKNSESKKKLLPTIVPGPRAMKYNSNFNKKDPLAMKKRYSEKKWDILQRHSRCSALIKVLPDFSDIYVGHTTWADYSELLRIWKTYNFQLKDPTVVAKKISFLVMLV